MPALSDLTNHLTNKHVLLIAIWLIFTVSAFAILTSNKLIDFDANNKLSNVSSSKLTEHFNWLTNTSATASKRTIIHFSQTDCHCNSVSDLHIRAIGRMATNNDFNVINKTLTSDSLIPSTPSIAIIDDNGNTLYFGPYGEGIGCSQTGGYAKTMLNNYILGYSDQLIVTSAKGCYCLVS